MNVKQLLSEIDFEKVWSVSGKNVDEKEVFEDIYFKLLCKTPKPNIEKMKVKVEHVINGDESYFDVVGILDGDNQHYSISMTNWDKIAGYDVEINDIPIETFIIELLSDISFYGMEEDMIKQRDDLFEMTEGIKNGSIKTIPLDELFKGLDD